MNDKPYLLVDSSYVSFYRFFSTLIWYTNTYPEIEINDEMDLIENEVFMEHYDKYYMNSINKFRCMYDIPYENIILVRDCPREQIWRMDIYPEYKATRKNTCSFKNKRFNVGNIFKHIYSKLYPDIEEKYKINIIKFDNAEADDVIAVLSKKIHEIDMNRLIVIITNDNDYLQLVNNKILIWSLQNKLLNTKVETTSEQLLLKKIFKGDESDNILPCSNLSDEDIDSLVKNKFALEKYLNENNDIKDKFEKNKQLVDFEMIPDILKNKITEDCKYFLPEKRIVEDNKIDNVKIEKPVMELDKKIKNPKIIILKNDNLDNSLNNNKAFSKIIKGKNKKWINSLMTENFYKKNLF